MKFWIGTAGGEDFVVLFKEKPTKWGVDTQGFNYGWCHRWDEDSERNDHAYMPRLVATQIFRSLPEHGTKQLVEVELVEAGNA